MQVRGRHRGLPYALDKAILLPSEGLHRKEEDDAIRRRRASTYNTTGDSAAAKALSDMQKRKSEAGEKLEKPSLRQRAAKSKWPRLLANVFSTGPTNRILGASKA